MSEEAKQKSGVEPELHQLWDESKGDEGQYRCSECDGRVLRVANTGECLECRAEFKRKDENSLWRKI